jgi:thiamine biosynthesis protein ThiS
VKLHGETKRGVRGLVGDVVEADVPEGLTVDRLLAHLGVDRGEVWLSAVNREVVKPDHPLRDGDSVEVFAPVAGGATPTHPRFAESTGVR